MSASVPQETETEGIKYITIFLLSVHQHVLCIYKHCIKLNKYIKKIYLYIFVQIPYITCHRDHHPLLPSQSRHSRSRWSFYNVCLSFPALHLYTCHRSVWNKDHYYIPWEESSTAIGVVYTQCCVSGFTDVHIFVNPFMNTPRLGRTEVWEHDFEIKNNNDPTIIQEREEEYQVDGVAIATRNYITNIITLVNHNKSYNQEVIVCRKMAPLKRLITSSQNWPTMYVIFYFTSVAILTYKLVVKTGSYIKWHTHFTI